MTTEQKQRHEELTWRYDKYHRLLAHARGEDFRTVRSLEENALAALVEFEMEHGL